MTNQIMTNQNTANRIRMEDPIRLTSFRQDASRTRSGAMQRQMHLSFALVALLTLATAAIGISGLYSIRPMQESTAQSTAAPAPARG